MCDEIPENAQAHVCRCLLAYLRTLEQSSQGEIAQAAKEWIKRISEEGRSDFGACGQQSTES